jgi:hypothetical protein
MLSVDDLFKARQFDREIVILCMRGCAIQTQLPRSHGNDGRTRMAPSGQRMAVGFCGKGIVMPTSAWPISSRSFPARDYFRFHLSLRMVQEMLAMRGVDVNLRTRQ